MTPVVLAAAMLVGVLALTVQSATAARTPGPQSAHAAQDELPPAQYELPPDQLAVPIPPGVRPRELMSPFPVVRIVGRLTPRGARIRILSVRAPASATILVRCRGRGCSRRSQSSGRGMRRAVRFRRFERRLRTGTIIEVLVGRADAIGKFTRFRIRRGRAPARRDMCLLPGETRGSECPER